MYLAKTWVEVSEIHLMAMFGSHKNCERKSKSKRKNSEGKIKNKFEINKLFSIILLILTLKYKY